MHDTDILFSKKELFIAQFSNGKNAAANLSKHGERIFPGENLNLIRDFEFTSTNGFPILHAYNGPVNFQFVPYIDRKKYDGLHHAIHFFLYDYRFKGLWSKLAERTYEMCDYRLLLTPDYSLAVDVPDFCNKYHLYLTRFIGAYWQQCGYDVLPTASWGNVNSFKYCFEGLPEHSKLAVSGMGHQKSRAHTALWHEALLELERQKSPTLIVVYGDEETVPGLQTPLEFIPSFISKRFRQ